MRQIFTIFFLLFSVHFAAGKTISLADAELVLQRLYKANGIFLNQSPPQLEIRYEKRRVAAYFPRQNKIVLEQATLDVCNSFGHKSLDALAFIIGHELTHFYQKYHPVVGGSTNYLGFHKSMNAEIKIEKQADIHGLFNAYLADYKAFDILPDLILELYKQYDLLNVKPQGYPPLHERQNIANEVIAEVQKMVKVHDISTYLTAIGKYDLALAGFEYLEQYYKGKEIYNNLAVNAMLEAINFSATDVDKMLYPLEIDWNARIKEPFRGYESLSASEQAYRTRLLYQAENYLSISKTYDDRHFSSQLNWMCLLSLKGHYDAAITYYYRNNLAAMGSTVREQALMRLILGIVYAKKGNQNDNLQARQTFSRLKDHQDPAIAYLANYNLKAMSYEKCDPYKDYQCWEAIERNDLIDNVRLHRAYYQDGFALNDRINLSIQETPNSLVYVFDTPYKTFSLQRIHRGNLAVPGYVPKLQATNKAYKTVLTDTGHFQVCESRNVVLRTNERGRILEWAKWWE